MSKNIYFYLLIGCGLGMFLCKSQFNDYLAARIIFWVLLGIILLVFGYIASILIYCKSEDKKISAWLDADDYDNLLAYGKAKKDKKKLFVSARRSYYIYISLLSYLAKDNLDEANKCFDAIEEDMFKFPLTYYWKSCVEFTNHNYKNLELYNEKFNYHYKPLDNSNQNLKTTLSAINLYAKKDYKNALETANKIDLSRITMPSTLRAIDIVKSYKRKETTSEEN